MKIFILIFVIWMFSESATGDYPFKRRGSSKPPRAPPPPQYLKKWQSNRPPHRGNMRPPRPIPVHTHSIPHGKVPPPIGPPKKTNQYSNNRLFQNVPNNAYRKSTAKPFQSSRPLNFKPEFDYHLQANSIPNSSPIQNKVIDITDTIPIKQLDEKGPIHTIPAPNLSRDKPHNIEESSFQERKPPQESHRKPNKQHQQYQQQNYNQYQVTEAPSDYVRHSQGIPTDYANQYQGSSADYTKQTQGVGNEFFKQPQTAFSQHQPIYLQNSFQNQQQSIQGIQGQPHLVVTNPYENIPVEHTLALPSKPSLHNNKDLQQLLNAYNQEQGSHLHQEQQGSHLHQEQQASHSSSISAKTPVNPKDLQQFLDAYQNQDDSDTQSQFIENFGKKLYQPQAKQNSKPQPQLQLNIPDYQTMLQQAQLFQPEPTYLSQIQQAIGQNGNDKNNVQLHNFNYEDQISHNSHAGGSSSVKFPEYNVENEQANDQESRSNLNITPQNAYLQHLLNSDDENGESNQKKRRDSSSSISKNDQDHIDKEQISSFYLTLPNKEAAEALASLQEAGKINSNLMQMQTQDIQSLNLRPKNPLTIYVTDDEQSNAKNEDDEKVSKDVLDGLEEDRDDENKVNENGEHEQEDDFSEGDQEFGKRIRPKKNL